MSILKEYLETIQEAGVSGNIAAIIAFGLPSWAIWRTISAAFDKASRKCGTYEISDTRDSCIYKERIKSSEKRIDALKKFKKEKCKEKYKEDKCKKSADVRIKYEKDLIKKYKEKLEELKK